MRYTVAPRPKFSFGMTYDCTLCGRVEVKPVFLNDGHSSQPYGSGCAAKLMGYDPSQGAMVRKEYERIQTQEDNQEALRVERKERYARALESFRAGNDNDPVLNAPRQAYQSEGGKGGTGLLFPEYMARVAETGELTMKGNLVTATTKLGYGEQVAPPEVDTLRDEQCPVCGESSAYTGVECGVCGFESPPDAFMDPDLDKAKEMNLRQDADDAKTEDPGPELQCDNCGATFGGGTDPKSMNPAKPGSAAGPAAAGTPTQGIEQYKVAALPEPDKTQAAPGAAPAAGVVPHETLPSTEHAAGDQCPECGEGTLGPVQPDASPTEDVTPAPAEAPASEDDSDPDADPDKPDDAEEDDEDDDKPDFLKKKKGDDPPKDDSKRKKGSAMRPTLKALAEQQVMIQAQGEALDAIASAAGLDLTPIKTEAGRKIVAVRKLADKDSKVDGVADDADDAEDEMQAARDADGNFKKKDAARRQANRPMRMRRRADADNPMQPVDEPAAEAPYTTTQEVINAIPSVDVTAPGGGAPTEGVTPDAKTDVTTPGTVLDEPLDLNEQDVTAPVSGTQEPTDMKIDTDVRVGDPGAQETMYPLQGPFATKASAGRAFASMRLARLRIQAGIAPDQDDMLLGQAIASDSISDSDMQKEIATLASVIDRQPQMKPVARNLVPRTASAGRQTPSMAAPVVIPTVEGSLSPSDAEVNGLW